MWDLLPPPLLLLLLPPLPLPPKAKSRKETTKMVKPKSKRMGKEQGLVEGTMERKGTMAQRSPFLI